ncbi:toll/interleukin-1 receptor domain-containing adapter protein [Acanthopagrus latus]|uniref:toll/interleukin-1 receptor domain-containing adapter protein n=1 Tax=Acanthopagrus latus TaxID=8177 RepID=UPI00187C3761|nr:toll/interleukin-1 receptor domain-containing adapter protein [Acanthopagrus latus]
MGRRKSFIYWKYLGKALNKHDDVINMHGWFQKLKSRVSGAQRDQEEATKKSASSLNCASASPSSASSFCSSSSSSPGTNPSKAQSALSSRLRWSRKYDVFVCHSSVDSDSEEAGRLVSFLEASPRSLRCFLRERDDCPGAAISTELCQAVQNSHLWALLITPSFLQDDWCKYMMHQALAEGPMSNRIIPLVQNLPRSHCPQELRFFFCIDLNRNPDWGYTLLNKTVLKYLEDLVAKEKKTLDHDTDSSSSGLSGGDSSRTDILVSKCDPTDTSIPLELIKTEDGILNSDCLGHHEEGKTMMKGD